jgi:anti-sigma regulatory factor (Ser/Thr protein kinase)
VVAYATIGELRRIRSNGALRPLRSATKRAVGRLLRARPDRHGGLAATRRSYSDFALAASSALTRSAGSAAGPGEPAPDGATAGVPAGAGLSASYAARPESVAAARAAVVEFAASNGASPAKLEAVALAVSEAATNVVVHAYRDAAEPGAIEVAAATAGGELLVIVADDGSGLRPRRDSKGHGFGLIAHVSDGVDLVHRAAGGLELRMRFALTPA